MPKAKTKTAKAAKATKATKATKTTKAKQDSCDKPVKTSSALVRAW